LQFKLYFSSGSTQLYIMNDYYVENRGFDLQSNPIKYNKHDSFCSVVSMKEGNEVQYEGVKMKTCWCSI